jgi:hypothetical protein
MFRLYSQGGLTKNRMLGKGGAKKGVPLLRPNLKRGLKTAIGHGRRLFRFDVATVEFSNIEFSR